jgi:hypothetical protein
VLIKDKKGMDGGDLFEGLVEEARAYDPNEK